MSRTSYDPERYNLQIEINQKRSLLATRKLPRNKGKYSKEEIVQLEDELRQLIKKRDALKVSKIKDGWQQGKSSISIDVGIAKELFYPKEVIKALQNEPDPDKRQRILRDARLGKR